MAARSGKRKQPSDTTTSIIDGSDVKLVDKRPKVVISTTAALSAISSSTGDFVRGKPSRKEQAAAAAASASSKGESKRDISSTDVLFGTKAVNQRAAALQAADDAAAPRTPKKRMHKREALKEAAHERLTKKAAAIARRKGVAIAGSETASSAGAQMPSQITSLSYGLLKMGMPLLGAIKSLNDKDLDITIALPNGLHGYVSLREVSDAMATLVDRFVAEDDDDEPKQKKASKKGSKAAAVVTERVTLPSLDSLFVVGQLVRVVVVALEKKEGHKRIELSMRAALVNRGIRPEQLKKGNPIYGSIKSIEDKGFIVDLGIPVRAPEDDDSNPLGASLLAAAVTDLDGKSAANAPVATITGFLQKSETDADFKGVIGQPIECTVRADTEEDTRVIGLSCKRDAVVKALVKETNSEVTWRGVKPGMRVRAEVAKVTPDGVIMKILGMFYGTVHLFHLAKPVTKEWAEEYEIGSSYQARVLFIDYATRRLGLTLLPHIVAMTPLVLPASITSGLIIEDALVLRVESKTGVLLSIPLADAVAGPKPKVESKKGKLGSKRGSMKGPKRDDEEAKAALLAAASIPADAPPLVLYAHISKVSEKRVTNLGGTYNVGGRVRARAIGVSPLDGVVSVTLNPTVIDQEIMWYDDLKAGQFVTGEVVAIESFGLKVKLAPNVRAICPLSHLADTNVSDPTKKFAVGKSLRFKVWDVDAASQKATITHKKTLLTSALPLITSYASATRGIISHGVITSVKDFGCIVEFYNNVHGLVSVKDLRKVSGLGETQSPEEAYHKGQVMKVRVKKCTPTESKLLLSFSTTRSDDDDLSKKEKYAKGLGRRMEEIARCLPAGAIVSGTVRGLWPKKVEDVKVEKKAEEKKDDDDSDDDLKKPEKEPMVSITEELKVEVVINELVDADEASESKETKTSKPKADASAPKVTVRRVFECILAAEHLTDHPANAAPLVALTQKEGTVLDTLCVLYVDREGRAHLTAKPSILAALDTRVAKPVVVAASTSTSVTSGDDVDDTDDTNMTPAKMADRKRRASLKIIGTPTTTVAKKDGPKQKKGSVKNGKEEKQVVAIQPPSNVSDSPDPSQVPESFEEVSVNMLLVGYVRQVVGYGVFVGFRGSLVALAPRAQLCDHFVTQPAHHFATGQSVRARVIEVDAAKKQFLVTLKPSQTSFSLDSDGAFVRSFFDERARIDAANGAPATANVDWSLFPFGTRIAGMVATVKDVGVLLTFPTLGVAPVKAAAKKKAAASVAPVSSGAAGVMGLAVVSQTGDGKHKKKSNDDDEEATPVSTLKELYKLGSTVDCRVLDVSRQRGIVDVSLRRDVVATAGKVRAVPPLGSVVQVEVQLVQKEYLVCSIPKFDNAVGFASTTSYNLRVSPHSLFKAGQKFDAYVYAVPDDKTDRILLVLNIGSAIAARKKKGGNFFDASIRNTNAIQIGSVVKVKVTAVKSPHVFVSFGAEISNLSGRIHLSELTDSKDEKKKSRKGDAPIADVDIDIEKWTEKVGQLITTKVLTVSNKKDKNGKTRPVQRVELTARPSDLASADPPAPRATFDNVTVGQQLTGVVNHVIKRKGSPPAIHVDISYALRATITGEDISSNTSVLDHLYAHFPVGTRVTVVVKAIDTEKHEVALVLRSAVPALATEVAATIATAAEKRAAHQAHVAANAVNLPQAGSVLNGTITKLEAGVGATVQLAAPHDKLHGRVHIMDIADDWVVDPLAALEEKQAVKVGVIAVRQDADGNNLQIDLSLRASAMTGIKKGSGVGKDGIVRDIVDASAVKLGDIVRGYVVNTSKAGCFIALNRSIIVRCQLKNLSNKFIANPVESYPAGKLVTCRVKAIEDGKIEVTLKKSAVNAPKDPVKFEELKVGMLVKGRVKAVDSKLGVFVVLKNSKIQALCHVSQISDAFVKDPAEHYEAGDRVKAVVTVLDAEKKRVSLALKASALETATSVLEYKRGDGNVKIKVKGDASDSEDDEDEKAAAAVRQANKEKRRIEREATERQHKRNSKAGQKRKGDETKDDAKDGDDAETAEAKEDVEGDDTDEKEVVATATKSETKSSKRVKTGASAILAALEADEDSDSDVNNDEDDNEPVLTGKKQIAKTVQAAVDKVFDEAPALQVDMKSSAASSRNDDDDEDTASSSGDAVDETEDGVAKPGRHAKAAAKRREEKRITEREELLSSADGARPTTAADFDRLVLTSPNSSVVWVNYIAHHVSVGEVDKARKVAERALKAISFREEKEKWNVWVALLSLENLYGTKETLADAFKRCLQYNDAKRSYLELAKVHAGANRHSDAVAAYTDATNKFHSDPEVWISFAIYLTKQNNYDEVRALMKRALEKLPKKEHVRIISKFATLEFRHGSAERGRTMFDGLVSSYPKRVDLWSVYLDQELRPEAVAFSAHHVVIRRLFERVISLNLSSKKSRFFFKRWLAFEKQYGNDATRDHVLARARAFVEGSNGAPADNDDGDDA